MKKLVILNVCAGLLLGSTVVGQAAGVTFYTAINFTGTASQQFDVGTYTLTQMQAKGYVNDKMYSFNWTWPVFDGAHSVMCYSDGSFNGTLRVYNCRTKCSNCAGTSSVKILASAVSGWISPVSQSGLDEFQSGFIYGDYIGMHYGDTVTIKSNGTGCTYYTRYETAYWGRSGNIVKPTCQVISGTNTKTWTDALEAVGTCTGTALPQQEKYSLNGTVKWTNIEGGCDVNFAIRDGHIN
jgi:hypothetical protein